MSAVVEEQRFRELLNSDILLKFWPLEFLVQRLHGLRIEAGTHSHLVFVERRKIPAASWNRSLVFKSVLINIPTELFWLIIIYE